jgi:pyridoxine 4-dehydrogenase
MNTESKYLGGAMKLSDDLVLSRMGYGAMQLAGPHVFGPPKDRNAAIAVLREAVRLGITHIDTSDFYGPYVTNEIIKEALYPYSEDLRIVTKVGARRDENGAWLQANSPEELRQAVHDNLKHLGLDAMDVVNLRVMDESEDGSIATRSSISEQFTVLVEMQKEGLIKHLGVSTVSAELIKEVQSIAPIVCVQNMYNIANRTDDALVDSLAEQGIAYVPYFPLGGFSPLQSNVLEEVATELNSKPMIVALAWLLQRSPNILLIPGTSSIEHLHENVAAVDLVLPADAIEKLNTIGA